MILDDQQRRTIQIRMLIGALHRAIVRNMEEVLAAHNVPISHLQFGLMMSLRHQAQTLSELSRMFGLDPSTLVPTVESLVKKGFVQRGVDPMDRRRSPISVTAEGTRLIEEITAKLSAPHDDILATCLQGIGDENASRLADLLSQLLIAMPDGESILHGLSERIQHHQECTSRDIDSYDDASQQSDP